MYMMTYPVPAKTSKKSWRIDKTKEHLEIDRFLPALIRLKGKNGKCLAIFWIMKAATAVMVSKKNGKHIISTYVLNF